MIELYDSYHQNSRDLHETLAKLNRDSTCLVINDDGFLPEGVTSPYAYFCQMEVGDGKALYFNQLPVPKFWEISGTNQEGKVFDYQDLRARIFYAEPKYKRLIKTVDWYDRFGNILFSEHYNQFGWCFARTCFTDDKQISTKTYFNQRGQEVLTENAMTGDIILTYQGQTHFFENRLGLIAYYLELMGLSQEQLIYNSLSTPFFYSYHHTMPGSDILFFQEKIGKEIPGNLKVLLANNTTRTQTIVVQDRETYEKLLTLLPEKDARKLYYLGYHYPSKRSNGNRPEILIVTNSDQLECLELLTESLSGYVFHIAALTEMSQKLLTFAQKPNVKLYPNVSQAALVRLFGMCDIYLDINRGNEVDGAVRRAFEENQLLFAFRETSHRPGLLLPDHLFSLSQVDQLIARLESYSLGYQQIVSLQRQKTGHETLKNYRQLLEGVLDESK